MSKIEFGFGPQLVLDIRGCNKEKLADKDFIFKLLDELPGHIGMTKIQDPNVVYYPGNENSFDKGGGNWFCTYY